MNQTATQFAIRTDVLVTICNFSFFSPNLSCSFLVAVTSEISPRVSSRTIRNASKVVNGSR